MGSDVQGPVKEIKIHKDLPCNGCPPSVSLRVLRLQSDTKSQKHDSYTHRLYNLVIKIGPHEITDNGIRKEIINCTIERNVL